MFEKSVSAIIVSFVAIGLCGDVKDVNKFLFSGEFEFVDLTHNFDGKTVYWPTASPFQFTNKIAGKRADGSWYAANEFCAAEHGGTHLDAPYHFAEHGAFVGDIPLENLIVPLMIADVSSQVNGDANFVLQKHHLDYMLNNFFGNNKQPCVVIFKFGWAKYFSNPERYLGSGGSNGTLNFPGISGEVAQWIVSSYPNIVGVGVDVASVDPGSSKDFPAHKILLGAGRYFMENVNLNRDIPESQCTALVLPMRLAAGSGAPLRLVAVCPRQLPLNFNHHLH